VPATINEIGLKRVKLAFCGLQEDFRTGELVPLWNLLEPVPGLDGSKHLVGSTLAAKSLERADVFVPNPAGWSRGDVFQPFCEAGK
jgi:hypothetical protein